MTTHDVPQPPGLGTEVVPEPAINHTDVSSEVLYILTQDRDRIARDLNDTLVHQMFAVSLDLHAALSRIDRDTGDHLAAEKIRQAISGLDQAIKDIRTAVVGIGDPPYSGTPT